ncbi:MAG: tetratricopeptide repeat protein [Ignavibacteria bacterium]|nr:tetratricopeptide repeat protein [Ignavibacteria bacterium]
MFKEIIKIFFVFFIITLSLKADDYKDAMLKAISKLNKIEDNDRSGIMKLRGDFERILQLKKNNWMVYYYMAYCDLLMSQTYMNEKPDKENIKKYTESAMELLNKATDLKDDFAEAYILKISVNSNRWQYEPEKMNDILTKGQEADDLAKKYGANNPRYYLVNGIITYFTPESFGGGVDKALPTFEKSWSLFESHIPEDETYPNWGKEQTAGMLALCYAKLGKYEDSEKWLEKSLEIKPDSGFIKNFISKEIQKAKSK